MKIKIEKWIFDDTCSYKVKSIKKCCAEILDSNLIDLVYDYDNEDDTDYSVKLIDRRHEYDGYDKDYYDYTVYENIYYCPFCGEKIEIEIVSVINKNKEYCELKNQRTSLYYKYNETDSIKKRDILREQVRELDNKINEFHINGDLKGEI